MSTRTSADLNVTRSTTRIHRPPGGNTTISFGDHYTNAPTTIQPSAEEVESDRIASELQIKLSQEITPEKNIKLSLVISGKAISEISKELTKALAKYNIKGASIIVVDEYLNIPYVVQKLLKSSEAIISLVILSNEINNVSAISQSLLNNLYSIGLSGNTPVIPGVLITSSLLEAKATLAVYSNTLVKALVDNLSINELISTPASLPDTETKKTVLLPTVTDPEVLLQSLRESLKANGATGIISLGRKFRIIDDDNSNSIDLAEFTKAISEHAFYWTHAQIKSVFDKFDTDKSGTISYDEFLIGVRGELNERRKQLVLQAFQILDTDKSGIIELSDISAKYDASKHPDVISGKRTSSEILTEFLSTFDTIDKDNKVSPEEFIKYYGNVSSSIDNDDYFELMIRNAWHISGGEGWCENSSNRRVLVTLKDGTQRVEEIKNDIGIKADDKEALLANLAAQGITDIVSIDLKGSSDSTQPAVAAPPASLTTERPAAGGKSNNYSFANETRSAQPATPYRRQPPGGRSSNIFG
eukprot:CAMPEP_0196761750 /NCGR_PEP_ID=MMETSP1095-20130614/1052_1 /TAXON_ID=96789 ORGANISM="Chromulina nebulosa, Strain UTEXLB2642" /NCGR_SAMPLE_ID=MMETSP1095 /ASSEMBLY_ACC=CAM_ASM_000446 /LENGTH=528 /DNA_ID=CAMNT_0042111681 /DNA_START=8 /DNA_END=1594 /DNA_ORIENTATION=-